MKKNEKNLVILAGILFAAVLVFRVVPLVADYYQEGRDEIARLENRIDNYRRLVGETGRWIEREKAMRAEVAAMEDWVFTGSSANFIVTDVQRQLTRAAGEAGMTVRETALPDYIDSGGWLVVNQEITFLLDRQTNIIDFLALLEKSSPHLFVTEFSISKSRRQFIGSVVVTGFGKIQPPVVTVRESSANPF